LGESVSWSALKLAVRVTLSIGITALPYCAVSLLYELTRTAVENAVWEEGSIQTTATTATLVLLVLTSTVSAAQSVPRLLSFVAGNMMGMPMTAETSPPSPVAAAAAALAAATTIAGPTQAPTPTTTPVAALASTLRPHERGVLSLLPASIVDRGLLDRNSIVGAIIRSSLTALVSLTTLLPLTTLSRLLPLMTVARRRGAPERSGGGATSGKLNYSGISVAAGLLVAKMARMHSLRAVVQFLLSAAVWRSCEMMQPRRTEQLTLVPLYGYRCIDFGVYIEGRRDCWV
jgi:hypothetical protein